MPNRKDKKLAQNAQLGNTLPLKIPRLQLTTAALISASAALAASSTTSTASHHATTVTKESRLALAPLVVRSATRASITIRKAKHPALSVKWVATMEIRAGQRANIV